MPATKSRRKTTRTTAATKAGSLSVRRPDAVIERLKRIEKGGGEGEIAFGPGKALLLTSLGKPYFPGAGVTKGDVMRYYAAVAPLMLPHLKDRPIALARFPEGIEGHSFYQQNAPRGTPDFVRVESIPIKGGDEAERIVGCDLPTLLYLVQMGAIVVHAWFSRVQSLDDPDLTLIDLDPGEGVAMATVVKVARTVRAVTDGMGLATVVKTSGSRGLHIGIPLPRGVDYAASAALARKIGEHVVQKMPEVATLERLKAKRPEGSVLVDVNQNARGKTMVAPYSVRAREEATVSAPVAWTEVGNRLTMQRFTVRTMPRRAAAKGDAWEDALRRRNTPRTVAAALRG